MIDSNSIAAPSPVDRSPPARIGLVLSSGGVRGVFAHTGFMQAIQRLQIPIAASAGCSAGALVGGFAASGTPLQEWTKTLETISSHDFWTPDSLSRFFWKMTAHHGRGYTGLSSTRAALNFTRNNITATSFEECLYPFHVLAVELSSGKKTVFSTGELAPRMTASAAMPILYEPVRIDSRYYCDGAVVDFAPTDAICCRHRLDVVIVHHVSQQLGEHRELDAAFEDSWAMLQVLNRLVFRQKPWYLSGKPITLHHCPCGCGAIIIVLEPELPTMRWPSIQDGDSAQRLADQQTSTLLQPYLNAMLDEPRKHLSPLVVTGANPDSGCGIPEP